jgi:hypothetical protein
MPNLQDLRRRVRAVKNMRQMRRGCAAQERVVAAALHLEDDADTRRCGQPRSRFLFQVP